MIRQQVNAQRPMTSGKPGMRGFHGIGAYKPAGGAPVSNPDELDDFDNVYGAGSSPDPLAMINQKKAQK